MTQKHLPFVPTLVFLGLIGASSLMMADEMRVRDLPVPDGAMNITYMKQRGDVRCQVPFDFKTAGNSYARQLAAQQWTKSARDNLQDNFWVQTYSKNNVSLVVRVSSREGGSDVRLTPTGMMWDEDSQPTPKDLPYPEGFTDIEYSDFFETIKYKCPSDVKTVANYLSEELQKKEWTPGETDFNRDEFVRLNFSHQTSTLTIDIRANDAAGADVSIRTKGMQWDGMKEEIAQAEAEAEKVEAEQERERKTAEMAEALAKRRDKPKQGIDKLPKLPNKCTVVMDGTTYELSHFIAYEMYEYNRWTTRIVATNKPIKQASLLTKLKKIGSEESEDERAIEDDISMSLPVPFLEVVLDEDDQPHRLNFRVDSTPGGGSGDELIGSALVEGGRVRGTVALKEPGSFFEKVYTGEISFDLPVLTRDSKPEKQLANASRLANSGKLVIGNKTYKLANVVGYEMKLFDDPMTAIVLSEKPLNMPKLKAAVGRKAADDYFEFTPQVKLLIDADDNVTSVSIWADNMSVGSNDSLDSNIVIEDGRARGTSRMTKPDEFMNREYSFEVSFDVQVMGGPVSRPKKPTGGLVADSHDGLPVPEKRKRMLSEGSLFRTQTNMTAEAPLNAVVDFYRGEMTSGDWGEWKENAAESNVENQSANLTFTGPTGSVIVQLKASGQETEITLVSRDAVAAKRDGLLPAPGRARLVIANMTETDAVVTINGKDYTIAAGAGADDPKTGLNWEVAPGTFNVVLKQAGGNQPTEKLKLATGETWGVIIDPFGGNLMSTQIY